MGKASTLFFILSHQTWKYLEIVVVDDFPYGTVESLSLAFSKTTKSQKPKWNACQGTDCRVTVERLLLKSNLGSSRLKLNPPLAGRMSFAFHSTHIPPFRPISNFARQPDTLARFTTFRPLLPLLLLSLLPCSLLGSLGRVLPENQLYTAERDYPENRLALIQARNPYCTYIYRIHIYDVPHLVVFFQQLTTLPLLLPREREREREL